MDNILEYGLYIIDLSQTLLAHRQGLNAQQTDIIETVHRRSEQFVADYMARYRSPIRQLASYLNHDALSPITVMIGYTEMLLMNAAGDLQGDYREAIQYLRDCSYALYDEVIELQTQMVKLRSELCD